MKIYIRTFLSMATFFAVVHIVILLGLVIFTGDISYLNVFYILGITELFPQIDEGIVSNLLSACIIFSVYIFFFRRRNRK